METLKYTNVIVVVILFNALLWMFVCGSKAKGYSNISCVESEKKGLLEFRRSLVDSSNMLSSWIGNVDCCAWYGVGCNKRTGHVIELKLSGDYMNSLGGEINPSLVNLKYLTHLDLSSNNFSGFQIPEFFGSFKDLIHLNLGDAGFKGLVPHHLGNLSTLQYLILNSPSKLLGIDSMWWVSKLSSLKHLDLSGVNLSKATDWLPSINVLPNSLLELNLIDCQLMPSNNIIPSVNLTSLVSLDLSINQLDSTFPIWVSNNTGLTYLSLSSNYFYGPIPESIGRLTSLSVLHLFNNKFQGSIPTGMTNLTRLQDLEINNNEFNGCLPDALATLSKLEFFSFYNNQLSGSIPWWIGQLSKLMFLDLSSNSWEGTVSEHHFAKLSKLKSFRISFNSNNLVMNVSSEWVPPFQLQHLHMSSCKVGPQFPPWIRTQTGIEYFIMSNASISDTIPDWFGNILSEQAFLVDLSDNEINGKLPVLISRPSPLLVSLQALLLSNNRFTGGVPMHLCNISSLRVIDLSKNQFSGLLPRCLGNLQNLEMLDVTNNTLSGRFPFSLGSLTNLKSLHLHNNRFHGKLPLSFQNLKNLIVLDLGNNNFSDIIPPWIGQKLSNLNILNFCSNQFYGEIPPQLCHLSTLHILNLEQNRITGGIPPCFGNFTAMMRNGLELWRFNEKILDNMKGSEIEYTKTLPFLISIDLSQNNIIGEIPEELMDLSELMNLNVSGNQLTGRIPEAIGKLEKLESLDLSRNKLCGPIPQSLSDLYSLSHLNLSFNNLSGRIPTGNQLQTLDGPIYAGNNQLCGERILKRCPGDEEYGNVHEPSGEKDDDDDDDQDLWFYCAIGPGFSVGILGFWGILYVNKSWRYAYFQFFEKAFDKIYRFQLR